MTKELADDTLYAETLTLEMFPKSTAVSEEKLAWSRERAEKVASHCRKDK